MEQHRSPHDPTPPPSPALMFTLNDAMEETFTVVIFVVWHRHLLAIPPFRPVRAERRFRLGWYPGGGILLIPGGSGAFVSAVHARPSAAAVGTAQNTSRCDADTSVLLVRFTGAHVAPPTPPLQASVLHCPPAALPTR